MENLQLRAIRKFRHSISSHSSTPTPSSTPPLAPSPTHITPGLDIAWSFVGHGEQHLVHELETLYWDGIAGELANIVRTLQAWQTTELAGVRISEESGGGQVDGFDTFLDAVSQNSREYAARYGTFEPLCFDLHDGNRTFSLY